MIFCMKVGRSNFLRGASQKASIAHLCSPPHPPPPHHLPPWVPLHHEWYQGSLLLPGRYVLSLYHHLIVCFAKRIIVFDWFFVKKSNFPHLWLAVADVTMFFLVHMIVMMALCPCQEHYLLCYCSLGLSITRMVMFVVFFNWEKSLWSFVFDLDIMPSFEFQISCDVTNNEMYDLLPSCHLQICILLLYIIIM
jgi:hypothetical protein